MNNELKEELQKLAAILEATKLEWGMEAHDAVLGGDVRKMIMHNDMSNGLQTAIAIIRSRIESIRDEHPAPNISPAIGRSACLEAFIKSPYLNQDAWNSAWNSAIEAALEKIPGGNTCDPQAVADDIRSILPTED